MTIPTIFELTVRIERGKFLEKEKRKITAVMKQLAILELTTESAEMAGRKLGELYRKGKPIDPIDAQIVGIAIIQKKAVVTRNVKHSKRISELKIEQY